MRISLLVAVIAGVFAINAFAVEPAAQTQAPAPVVRTAPATTPVPATAQHAAMKSEATAAKSETTAMKGETNAKATRTSSTHHAKNHGKRHHKAAKTTEGTAAE